MADYISYVKSDFFKVKDINAFKELCKKYELDFFQDENGEVCFWKEGINEGIPEGYYENGEFIPSDFFQELSRHLVKRSYAKITEIGREKMRYLVGCTFAVHSSGEILMVSLDDIDRLIKLKWPSSRVS